MTSETAYLNLEMIRDGSFREWERTKKGFDFMTLVGIRPVASLDAPRRVLRVRVRDDMPDGTYWLPGVQIVIRTSAGWSLWRYVLTILKTVLRARNPRIGNLILTGAGIGRLAGVPGIRWLKGWAIDRGVAISGFERHRGAAT